MKYKALMIAVLLSGQMTAEAVTNVVLPGDSIQAKIDISTHGDTVAIFGGVYNQDLVVTQSIRLVEVTGQDVVINGSLRISGVTNPPPLEGFTIGSVGRGLTISNTSGILLNFLDLRAGAGLATKGSAKVRVQNCLISAINAGSDSIDLAGISVIGDINQDKGMLYVANCGVGGSVKASASCTSYIYRCVITNNVLLQGEFNVMAYSRARSFSNFVASAVQRLIGCEFNRDGVAVDAIQIDGISNDVLVANCEMKAFRFDYGGNIYRSHQGISIGADSSWGALVNNFVQGNFGGGYFPSGNTGIDCASAKMRIINNIVITKSYGIAAPFGSTAYGNYVYDCTYRYANGVIPTEDYNLNPMYDMSQHSLLPGSPCIDGGTTDPCFRDRDGSRADAGPTGGSWFDPGAWTTAAPVVVSFDLMPEKYLEGTITNVILFRGQAVSLP